MADYCINCGDEKHRIDTCEEPIQPARFTQSGFRANVYSLIPKTMMKIRLDEPKTIFYIFDTGVGNFVIPKNGLKLFSPATEGYFVFNASENIESSSYILTYNGTTVKRFSVAFAVLHDGFWRLRHRCTLSPFEGVVFSEMNETLYKNVKGRYSIPGELKMNTVLIVGVETLTNSLMWKVRVNANESGDFTVGKFNGYEGSILHNIGYDSVLFSESLRPENIIRRLFRKELYFRSDRDHKVPAVNESAVDHEKPSVSADDVDKELISLSKTAQIGCTKSIADSAREISEAVVNDNRQVADVNQDALGSAEDIGSDNNSSDSDDYFSVIDFQ